MSIGFYKNLKFLFFLDELDEIETKKLPNLLAQYISTYLIYALGRLGSLNLA